jgi:hypothetical protein
MSTPNPTVADSQKTASTKWWSIGGTVAILILTWLLLPSSPKIENDPVRGELQQGELRPPPQTSSGVIEINKDEWRGVTCLDGRMRIDGKLLTSGVWWEVRLDKDDGRIHPLYPRNYSPGKRLEITNGFNIMEWRIRSDQTIDHAQVIWSISPKR